jgi:arsenite-transporting ATPase
LKDHISNYSLPLSTLSKRLYVVTGKGGTGKTSVALALAHDLQKAGKEVLFYQSQPDQAVETAKELNIPILILELYESTEEYIAKKLGQRTIASWILKAPFFKSLLDILPSLGDLILLGHLIEKLEKNPELVIVMDAPSTGHTLSFFESPENFKSIFKTGMLANDIDRILGFLRGKDNLFFLITSLPSIMAVQESMELKRQLEDQELNHYEIIINNYLEGNPSLSQLKNEVPDFLKKKMELEKQAISEAQTNIQIPYYMDEDQKLLVQNISHSFDNWEAK